MELQGPSFPLTWTILQSVTENRPPQPAKLAPNWGALVLRAVKLPHSLWLTPTRKLQKPLNAWKVTTTHGAYCKGPTTVILKVPGSGSCPCSSISTLWHRDARPKPLLYWWEDCTPGRPGNLSKDSPRADQRRTSPVSSLNTKCKVCAHILTYLHEYVQFL